MSLWQILAYLAVGYGVMFGVWALGYWLFDRHEARARIRRRLGIAPR